MTVLYHGKGADYHPKVPLIDRMLSDQIQVLGFQTKRYGDDCTFTSTKRDQANGYAVDENHLFEVGLEAGTRLMLVEDCADMVLNFENWLRDQAYFGWHDGSARSRMIKDVQGDIDIVETYLSYKRQKKVIAGLINEYLSEKKVRECVVDEGFDLASFLNGHEGEIVINGPVHLTLSEPLPIMRM